MDHLFLDEGDPRKYRGPMPPSKKDVLLQLAEGLAYIHMKKLIHRDIKLLNVLICIGYDETSREEKVLMKWADFGLSKRVSREGTASVTGSMGTPYWKAPEVKEKENDMNIVWGNESCTTKSDVFAEGLVFVYFIWDGKHPLDSNG